MSKLTGHMQREQALGAFRSGDFGRAYRLGLQLLKKTPRDPMLLEIVGVSASKLGQLPAAEKHLRTAIALAPDRSTLHQALGETFHQDNRLDEAIAEYDRAAVLDPVAVHPIAGKAALLERRGDAEGAIEILRSAVRRDQTGHVASILGTALQSLGRHDETISLLAGYLDNENLDHRSRSSICRTIAKAYEKNDDYDAAFAALTRSNQLNARPFDRKAYTIKIDDLIATFSPHNMAMLARPTKTSDRPVFVACMPRSGSTLAEQVIHAHPKGHGAGEINDIVDMIGELTASLNSIQIYPDCLGDWTRRHADRLQKEYLASLRDHDHLATRVVNKHLENWLHLGMIALLFPGAKVVHTIREPMDNCFSIFMAAMHTDVYPWSTDLADIAFVYRQHERLMVHWRDTLDLDILETSYESFVADPEPAIRGIIGHVGLEWDERCLRFHESKRDVDTLSYDQVRRPVYNSAVGRWKRYESHLAPLAQALGID